MEAYILAAIIFVFMLFDDRYIGIFARRAKPVKRTTVKLCFRCDKGHVGIECCQTAYGKDGTAFDWCECR
jgi:hypothetical protein